MDDSARLTAFLLGIGSDWKRILAGSLVGGVLALGGSMLLKPTFTARVLLMPPQQNQNAASALLGSLGPLAGLAGAAANLRNVADVHVALMGSVTVSDRIIDRFDLMKVYDEDLRVDARKELARNVTISVGKKDGLLMIEVDDHDPARAAEMANRYVEELKSITNTLAVSEAQQRRRFFESKLEEAKARLTRAQEALQASGFNASVLKAEPRAQADGYARLRAELVAAEVKLQSMERMLTGQAPELQLQQATVTALRAEMAKYEGSQAKPGSSGSEYIGLYREYKYQETLFELYAKQFELARADEAREGALIQVVDKASPPEKRSKPKRSVAAVIGALLAGFVLCLRAGMARLKF